MIIVKLTVLAVMVTALYIWIWRVWLKSNPEEALKTAFNRSYLPKSGYPIIILLLLDIIGIFASAIYLLFLR